MRAAEDRIVGLSVAIVEPIRFRRLVASAVQYNFRGSSIVSIILAICS